MRIVLLAAAAIGGEVGRHHDMVVGALLIAMVDGAGGVTRRQAHPRGGVISIPPARRPRAEHLAAEERAPLARPVVDGGHEVPPAVGAVQDARLEVGLAFGFFGLELGRASPRRGVAGWVGFEG